MAIAPNEALELQSGSARGGVRDDARLVAALRSGEEGAFASLVEDYQTAIYNLAWRLVHDREDARDISQEVFLKAYRQIPKIEGELHLWAWLYRVTVNACWDHLRARSRRPVPLEGRPEVADQRAEDGEDQVETARLFSASLAQLPPRQQAALLLKDVHGLPHSDIAATLGISRGSSEVLLFRARRSFRNAFTAMTADAGREPVCGFAEQAAAHSVGGRLTKARRRRVLEHARTCPDCRATVERWGGAHAVGLGLALPLVAAPQLFGPNLAASAATNVAVSAGATAAASAGASSFAGGVAAKFAGLGLAKAAVVALAATTVVTYGGATAYKDYAKDGARRAGNVAAVAAAAQRGGASASHVPSAAGPGSHAKAGPDHSAVAGNIARRRPAGGPWFRALGSVGTRAQPARGLGLGRAARRSSRIAGRALGHDQPFAARQARVRRARAHLLGAAASHPRAVGRLDSASRPRAAHAARSSRSATVGLRGRSARAQPQGRPGARPAGKPRSTGAGSRRPTPPPRPERMQVHQPPAG